MPNPGKLPEGVTVSDARYSPLSGERLIGPFGSRYFADFFISEHEVYTEEYPRGVIEGKDTEGNTEKLHGCDCVEYLCSDGQSRWFIYGWLVSQ